MTQDEIIRMAREVDAITGLIGRWIFLDAAHLERFAALVAAHEREKCAVICDESQDAPADWIAKAIRSQK